jgi:hypothetical protein
MAAMTNESFFALLIASTLTLFFGFVLTFAGYRFFLFLLPIFGFFWGFGFGAQMMQAIFGQAFFATVTSWVVGFVFAMAFAALAYLFYFAGVAIVAGALGYAIGVALMEAIGFDFGLIAWLVGVVLGGIFAIGAIVLNLQKWVVIVATAVLGSGVIVGAFLYLFGGLPPAQLVANPVRLVLQTSPFWLIIFLVLAVLGIVAQYQATRNWEIATYNRWAATDPTTPVPAA